VNKRPLEEFEHYLVQKDVFTRGTKRLHLVILYRDKPSRQASAEYDLKHYIRELVLMGKELDRQEPIFFALFLHGELLNE
jgi:hypothetical protein